MEKVFELNAYLDDCSEGDLDFELTVLDIFGDTWPLQCQGLTVKGMKELNSYECDECWLVDKSNYTPLSIQEYRKAIMGRLSKVMTMS